MCVGVEGVGHLDIATSAMTIYDQGHKVCALEGTQREVEFVFLFVTCKETRANAEMRRFSTTRRPCAF